MQTLAHFIDGALVASTSDRTTLVTNPSTGDAIASVPMGTTDEVNSAVASAKAAFGGWSAMPPAQRARVLFRYKILLDDHVDELAALVSREHGKVLSDARGEVIRGIEVVEFACGAPHLLKGTYSQDVGRGVDCFDSRRPLGVCAGITPFNFPAMVPMWMFPIALAAGNTFVLKPSEKDPSCPLRLAELLAQAGLPKGVFNVVHGDKQAVDVLLRHPDVAALSFVGSTPIAKHIYEVGTSHGKRVQALGGAKNHMVVMPDADLDQVTDALMGSAYGSAGERCMAISVAVAVGGVGDALLEKLVPRVAQLRVGASDDPAAEMGPLVTAEHRDRVASYVDVGLQEGATLLHDGRDLVVKGHEDGFFLGPVLFDNVTASMKIYQDEVFGPFLCVVRVETLDDAITLVNNNTFGNGTAIFTASGQAARHYTTNVDVGMQGINVPIPVPMAFHSFGGLKDSIFGAHGVHGADGLHFYTKLRTVTARWPQGSSGADFSIPVMK